MRKVERLIGDERFVVELPDGASDGEAYLGILVGPPYLESLGLPDEVRVRLNRELNARGLITKNDVRNRTGEVFAALQAAFKIDVARVLNLYEGVENA